MSQAVHSTDPLIGQLWGEGGRYRLESLLGRGNRASVYVATDTLNERTVGVRILDPELCTNKALIDQFLSSIKAASAIQHPNILPILDYGTYNGTAFLVRPYVTGGTLRDRLGQPMSLGELITLLRPIANALNHAHRLGFVHGDLKPGNILLLAGAQPLLADLGTAQALTMVSSVHATTKGTHFGTPEYLSPEQGQGNAFDARADLYALGVIIFEALVGRPPFQSSRTKDTARDIVMAHVTEPPPVPSSFNKAIGPTVDQVLIRALSKRPDDRYQTAGALLTALETAGATDRVAGFALDEQAQQSGLAAEAQSRQGAVSLPAVDEAPSYVSPRAAKSRSVNFVIPGLLLVAVVALLAWFMFRGQNQPTPAPVVISSGLPTATVLPVPPPSQEWYFGQGSIGDSFHTLVMVTNPGSVDAHLTFVFHDEQGQTFEKRTVLPAGDNARIDLANFLGSDFRARSFAHRISSDVPVSVTHTIADQRYGQMIAGAVGQGTAWQFLENRSPTTFDKWIQVANFGDQPATVRITNSTAKGVAGTKQITAPAHTLTLVNLSTTFPEGVGRWNVDSLNGVPVVAEMTSYDKSGNILGDTMGELVK